MDAASAIPNSFFRLPIWENTGLYHMHELQHAAMAPISYAARLGKTAFHSPMNPLSYTPLGRGLAAASELVERMTKRYAKPEFGLPTTEIDGKTYAIVEETLDEKTFGRLLHFRKQDCPVAQPRLLIVAPMSGHYATLLRGTVEALLPFADVTITDWTDVRNVPAFAGTFDLDDYIQYVIDWLRLLGPNTHVMAVCQPAVPVLAAVSIMSANLDPNVPKSMTLIGGPIDTREAPTEVNRTATERPLSWFEHNVVTRVPANYPGFMRRVYPGFLQLTGFMTLNLERHIGAHIDLFKHLVQGDGEEVSAHKKFYNEYLSVMDITAEFYLQTIDTVFQRHALPKGEMMWRGMRVEPQKITRTGLLTLEGEKDDISGVGQTFAAQGLCSGLSAAQKKHHLQEGVGHYGLFNGRRFREQIVPVIVDFMKKQERLNTRTH